jgi:hypothetical protein
MELWDMQLMKKLRKFRVSGWKLMRALIGWGLTAERLKD